VNDTTTVTNPLLGFDTAGQPVHWNPDINPHLAISSGAGGGKTTALNQVARQLLAASTRVVAVDIKYPDAWTALEGVTLHTGVEDAIGAISTLGDYTASRNGDGARVALVIEDADDLIQHAHYQKLSRDLLPALARIAAEGRRTGHHLVLTHSAARSPRLAELFERGGFARLTLYGARPSLRRPRVPGPASQGLFADHTRERPVRIARPESGHPAA
jgi:hypothetical protein